MENARNEMKFPDQFYKFLTTVSDLKPFIFTPLWAVEELVWGFTMCVSLALFSNGNQLWHLKEVSPLTASRGHPTATCWPAAAKMASRIYGTSGMRIRRWLLSSNKRKIPFKYVSRLALFLISFLPTPSFKRKVVRWCSWKPSILLTGSSFPHPSVCAHSNSSCDEANKVLCPAQLFLFCYLTRHGNGSDVKPSGLRFWSDGHRIQLAAQTSHHVTSLHHSRHARNWNS